MNRHGRNASSGTKKPLATKAAAKRLAQVMSQGGDDEDEDEDDLLVDSVPRGGIGLGGRSAARPRSPMSVGRPKMAIRSPDQTPPRPRPSPLTRTSLLPNIIDQTPAEKSPKAPVEPTKKLMERPMMSGRPSSLSIKTDGQSSNRSNSTFRSSISSNASEQTPSPLLRPIATSRSSPMSTNSAADIIQPARSPMSSNPTEQSPSARTASAGRPGGMKTVSMVPPAVTLCLKQQAPPSPAADSRNKRLLDLGSMKIREPKEPDNQVSSTALQDQIDMIQEENDSLIEKLRLAEERFLECEARSKQMEKQVANLGEGVSMEARLLNRKEAALQQRESAFRAASQTPGGKLDQIANLTLEAENAKEDANSVVEQLHESKSELRSLKLVVQRLILTQEEMEEVVLKRCWLSRYWGLCERFDCVLGYVMPIDSKGIYPEIAEAKHEYWSSFAPLPLEIVIATGQKAKDDNLIVNNDAEEKHLNELSGEGNAETLLMLDKGLKELAQLKVEDALRIAMAQQRKKNSAKPASTEDLKSPSQKYLEDFELSQEESEEVQFKQSWLIYFWRRAKNHGLEKELADDRLQYWINNSAQAATSHEAVDVERGIMELRKLGIETQLWEESRRWLEQESQTRQTHF